MTRRGIRSLAREMGFDSDEHRLAYLGLLFTEVGDNAESDGCDEYWWRTAGLNAVLKEIDKRVAKRFSVTDKAE